MARGRSTKDGATFGRMLSDELMAGLTHHYRVAVRAAAFTFLRVAVMSTPVDTGALRNNWQISLVNGDAPLVMDRDGDEGSAPSMAQYQRAEAATAALPFGGRIFGSNPMEYASYVDGGTPRMNARPMVRPALAAANAVLRANRNPPPGTAVL